MPKRHKKTQKFQRISARIDENFAEVFTAYCTEEDLKPSQAVRRALKQMIPPHFFNRSVTQGAQ